MKQADSQGANLAKIKQIKKENKKDESCTS